jgi:hypothetical protein
LVRRPSSRREVCVLLVQVLLQVLVQVQVQVQVLVLDRHQTKTSAQ